MLWKTKRIVKKNMFHRAGARNSRKNYVSHMKGGIPDGLKYDTWFMDAPYQTASKDFVK